MNCSYRVIFCEATNTWVAVSEITRAKGKRSRKSVLASAVASALLAGLATFSAPPAWASPPVTVYYDCSYDGTYYNFNGGTIGSQQPWMAGCSNGGASGLAIGSSTSGYQR
jgi:hypothetical protein